MTQHASRSLFLSVLRNSTKSNWRLAVRYGHGHLQSPKLIKELLGFEVTNNFALYSSSSYVPLSQAGGMSHIAKLGPIAEAVLVHTAK